MSKKIIFLGPPSVGKTTLRKIFFEGESSKELLKFTLNPTYGQESIILNLNEQIGIFDLAGQEIQRWLETDEREIFYNTKVLLVVLDILSPINKIVEFTRKVVDIRNNLTPNTFIYFLIHKIDLVNTRKLTEIKTKIEELITQEKFIRVEFTSIKKEFFAKTFSVFIEILKLCLTEEVSFNKLDFNLLESLINTIYQIDKEVVISKKNLKEKLNKPEEFIDTIIETLYSNSDIKITEINEEKILSLTESGKNHFKEILKYFFLDGINQFKMNSPLSKVQNREMEVPPFIGFTITDKNGKIVLMTEVFDGAIDQIIKSNNPNENFSDNIDIDLIPLFFCALEKFSSQFNFQDITGINLKGSNVSMEIFDYNEYNVILFLNPNINIKPLENKIDDYFTDLFKRYDEKFQKSLVLAEYNTFSEVNMFASNWLIDINNYCENKMITSDIFDFEHTINLYKELEDIHEMVNLKHEISLEKVKKLKIDLTKAILGEEIENIKIINKKIQDLRFEFML